MNFDWKLNSLLVLPLAGLAVSSCEDYSPINEGEMAQVAVQENYENAFTTAFSDIDPNQNWGFDLIPFVSVNQTRASNTNSNEWESIWHYEVPGGLFKMQGNPVPNFGWARGDVSNYERAYVYWWFSTHQWPQTKSVNWDHYFLENVYGQPEHSGVYSDNTGWQKERFGMEYLKHINKGETPTNSPAANRITDVSSALAHLVNDTELLKYSDINDYNQCGQQKEQVMYEYRSSTEDFIFKASFDNTEKNNWTIQYINGEYYLGLDYWHDKKNYDNYAYIAPDGYYNDWIVKLSGGTHQVNKYTRRIMCEDLGNSYDWDFNDVVFDVTAFVNEGKKVMITLQAAGGTLPIYIGDMDHEAHALFGVSTDTPVNVQTSGIKRPAVVFTLAAKEEWIVDGMLDPNKVPVYVPVNSSNEAAWGNESGVLALNAPVGKAPQKFACPSDTYWMQEITDIRKANKENFEKWVSGEIKNDSWVISATINHSMYNSSLHYADYGTPYSSNYSDGTGSSNGPIRPWKELWNEIVSAGNNQGINDPQFTMEREYIQSYNGSTHQPEKYDKRSFIEQAPYIYETIDKNDDPIIFSAMYMEGATSGAYSNYGIPAQKRVWPTNGFCTLTLVAEPSEGGKVSGAGSYRAGSRVNISATANEGYKFMGWSNQCNTPTQSYEINQDMTLIASFAKYDYLFGEFTATESDKLANEVDLFTKFNGLKAKGSCYIKVTFNASSNNSVNFELGSVADYSYPAPTSTTKAVTLEWQNSQETLKIIKGAESITKLEIYTLN